MTLGDGIKCKTCFGCPRMVLCGPWRKNFFSFSKIEFGLGWPPPPPRFGESPDFLQDLFFCETFPNLFCRWKLLHLSSSIFVTTWTLSQGAATKAYKYSAFVMWVLFGQITYWGVRMRFGHFHHHLQQNSHQPYFLPSPSVFCNMVSTKDHQMGEA